MKILYSREYALLIGGLIVSLIPISFGTLLATVSSAEIFLPIIDATSIVSPDLPEPAWNHISTKTNDLPLPGGSNQQVLALVGDIDLDGINDFVIGARRAAGPSLVWYRRDAAGWTRHVVETEALQLEAGGALFDVDGDGDLDIVDGSNNMTNQIWWWENPHPDYAPNTNWTRRFIKNGGAKKHHGVMFGNFDDDPGAEFVYWNQGAQALFIVDVPANPRNTQPWPNSSIIYNAPDNKREGLAQADVDGDGQTDIIGGGYWFKHENGSSFTAHLIENAPYKRVAVGQLIPGGRPEIVQTPGDDNGPARWFQWDGSAWVGHDLPVGEVRHGHSLEIADINGDGLLDIFIGEMRFEDGNQNMNANARTLFLPGDGTGNFSVQTIATGFGHHESRAADLDGDGDLDILGKPFTWDTPRLDIWLQGEPGDPSVCEPNGSSASIGDWTWQRRVIDSSRPGRATFLFDFDVDGDGRTDIMTGKFWYRQPGTPNGNWTRTQLPAPLEDIIAAYDFDNDGDVDLLGTAGPTLPVQNSYWAPFVWARNEGGQFTILSNIDNTDMDQMPSNDPVQGVAVARFTPGGPLQIAVTWDNTEQPTRNPFGVQLLTVPTAPSTETWERRTLSDVSVGEELSAVDVDSDGDLDLFMGYMWLRNDGSSGQWPAVTIFTPETGQTSRHRVVDVDGDGDLDAVVGYAHGGQDKLVTWYEQRQPGAPWQLHIIDNLPRGDAESMDVVDMDNDGDPDVIVGEYNHNGDVELSGALFIFENRNGAANWTRHEVYNGDSHYQSSRAIDIDADGDFDIAAKGWHHNDVYLYEQLGCNASVPTPASTSTPSGTPAITNTPTETGTPTETPTSTAPPTATTTPTSLPPSNQFYYFSFAASGMIGNLAIDDEDIVRFDPATGTFSLFFDGTDVGLSANNVDAFHLRPDGTLLLSLTKTFKSAETGKAQNSDILRFTPVSLGENTSGSFALHFDGSDVGLSGGERIDGLAETPDGGLLISTYSNVAVPGVEAGDKDLLLFSPTTLGTNTSGSWSLYFKGANVGLTTKSENIRGVAMFDAGHLYLSMKGKFQAGDASGGAIDILQCSLVTTGQQTACSPPPSVFWQGSSQGLGGMEIDALHIGSDVASTWASMP